MSKYTSDLMRSLHLAVEDTHAVGAMTDKEKERFDKACLVLPEKNGDFLVDGKPAKDLNIEAFTSYRDMHKWKERIFNGPYNLAEEDLEEVFGKAFADRFDKHLRNLIARERLPGLYIKLQYLERSISRQEGNIVLKEDEDSVEEALKARTT